MERVMKGDTRRRRGRRKEREGWSGRRDRKEGRMKGKIARVTASVHDR